MALIKVLNKEGKYHDTDAREMVINYILNPAKAISGFIGCTSNVNPLDIAGSMELFAQEDEGNSITAYRYFLYS